MMTILVPTGTQTSCIGVGIGVGVGGGGVGWWGAVAVVALVAEAALCAVFADGLGFVALLVREFTQRLAFVCGEKRRGREGRLRIGYGDDVKG